MRQFLALSATVLVASLVSAASVGACGGGDDSAGPAATDASDEVPLLCDTFTGSGTACAPVSEQTCFSMCVTGGCQCVAGANGGVWKCTDDESCYPGMPDLDSGPLPDGSLTYADAGGDAPEGSTDASSEGGDADTGSEAGDASDASDGS